MLLVARGDAQTNGNRATFHDTKVVLTGVLLVSDWRCEEQRGKWSGLLKMVCPDRLIPTDWGLVTGREHYLLLGNAGKFKKYERSRVTVRGVASGRTIAVDSVEPARVTNREILDLIDSLRFAPWGGPGNQTITIHWFFDFTEPMPKILQTGMPAQDLLLRYLDDREIKDQIIILLGGVGDEKAIERIIQAMPTAAESYSSKDAKRTNFIAEIALTNITTGGVNWHHGGGISIDACPEDPKYCWSAWWTKNRGTFRVTSRTVDRAYSNYPNYGIYQQP